jgi:diguanylate cyclase (GGDEF)-like protein/PAS domain S-box-containing protein
LRLNRFILKYSALPVVTSIGIALVTCIAATIVGIDLYRDRQQEFSAEADKIQLKVNERLNAYALILRGAAGLFDASDRVTRRDWKRYVESLRPDDSVPGVQGVGFSQVVQPGELASHIAAIRAEGFPSFSVRPAGKRDLYTSIIYIEPFADRNLRAFGYDMYAEPVRREAMERSRDRGEPALTGKVVLVQETESEIQPGTLMYVPVYRKNASLKTVEERRRALMGWTYSPYRMKNLMTGILGSAQDASLGTTLRVAVFDGDNTHAQDLLFESQPQSGLPAGETLTRKLSFHGRDWLLVFEVPPVFVLSDLAPALGVLLGGFLIAALIGLLLQSARTTQQRAESIAAQLTEEIRASRKQLAESEFRWRFALEGAGDGLWDWNIAEGTVFFSARWKEMLGYAASELSNSLDEWKGRLHPEDRERVMAEVQNYLAGKTASYASEQRMLTKDGRYIWILDRGVVVNWDAEGKPVRMIGTHTDITERKQLELSLRLNQAELQEAQRIGNIGNWHMDVATGYVQWSPHLFRMFALEPARGAPSFAEQARIFSPDSWTRLSAAVDKLVKTGEPYELDLEIVKADQSTGFMVARGEAVFDPEGRVTAVHGVAADITQRKLAEQRLHLAASVFSHTREGILITGADGVIIDVNDAFTNITGFSRQESLGQKPNILKSGQHDAEFYRSMWQSLKTRGYWSGEIHNRRKSGEQFIEMLTISAVQDEAGKTVRYVGLFSDITLLKEQQRRLEIIAHYDALTGLPNRVLLADRMHQAMVQAERRQQQLAVAYIDLDGFKGVNDKYGHDAGDQLLMAVANHMKSSLREGDTLARLGGDEFVALLLDLADTDAANLILERLLKSVHQPTVIGNVTVELSASIGVTFYPQEGDQEADQLLRQADQAMYQAKLTGRNRYAFFDRAQDYSLRNMHESLQKISAAHHARQFVLYYQPKVNMRTGEVIGLEALIRWQHPERGVLSPMEFIPLIENDPLGIEISEWVIEESLRQIGALSDQGYGIQISCNLMAQHMRKPGFAAYLQTVLARFPQINPQLLQFEILETSALGDLSHISRLIDECRKLGVSFALDDFGTGYSSLTYLKRLAAEFLKIDQSFIRDMPVDPEALAIIEGVLGLAAAFGRHTIAEGVETEAHGKMLLTLGCTLGQGYAIARPMPAEKLTDWLRTWRPYESWRRENNEAARDVQILHAQVEHRAWLRDLEQALRGERSSPPETDASRCRFGTWLNSPFAAEHLPAERLNEIRAQHEQLHQLAERLLHSGIQQQTSEFTAQLQRVHELSDELLQKIGDS